LDAFNAQNVVQTLVGLARNGRAVVMTVHQPRSNIFSLFDMLLLLSEGQIVYFGPAKDALSYFSALGYK
jgi:ABC-type multidrug transport system ATPase subunit